MRKTGTGYRVIDDLATTDSIMRDTFWIGVYPGMTEDMVQYMVDTICEVTGKKM
jgi:CDP-6-deoxy-D-xylo-4-hexulose-3-dehydrase